MFGEAGEPFVGVTVAEDWGDEVDMVYLFIVSFPRD